MMFKLSYLSILLASSSDSFSLAQQPIDAVLNHFRQQVETQAHLKPSTKLPSITAKSMFHLDMSLYNIDDDIEENSLFEKIIDHEEKQRSFDSNNKYPYILCGSQQTAKLARSEIHKFYTERLSIVHASRKANSACWRAPLNKDDVEELRSSSSAFFHITEIPSVGKFAPLLISKGNLGIVPSSQALTNGINVQIERGMSIEERGNFVHNWQNDGFGLKVSTDDYFQKFYSTNDDTIKQHKKKDNVWRDVRSSTSNGACRNVLKASLAKLSQPTDLILEISFKLVSSSEADDSLINKCLIASLIYISTQSEVVNIEPVSSIVLHALVPTTTKDKSKTPTLRASRSNIDTVDDEGDDAIEMKPLNTISTTALQSGDESDPNPFWSLGINGTGQFVEVADTGFDDASCFLRQADSASVLTGSFNGDVQVARTAYNVATTDFTRRKVVQYIMRDTSEADYGYDYASGHGTHCAGTVAGFVPNDGSEIDPDADYYSNCADFSSVCTTRWCPTCYDAGYCDTTCGFPPTDVYSGMAPGAKMMVYDFGDSSGSLSVPSDMDTYILTPAYDQGARIFSNSWGSGAPYNYYDSRGINIDQFVYDEDDALIVFAAGNNNYNSGDDTYESGDGSLGSPSICKNVLTVGAAETDYTPDTLAYFSSRGPTPDFRIKPEVSAPGNPTYSTKASGSAGLASCATTSKSGTSMATPAVAGTAALLRQILVEGLHSTFSSNGFYGSSYTAASPSGALLKAMLIGSTVPLTYGYDSSYNTVTLTSFYGASSAVADSVAYALGTDGLVDFSQGFGHVRVSNIFSLDGSFETFLFEDSLAEYSTWTQEFEVKSVSNAVAVTLVWTDPPGASYCGYDYYDGDSTDTCLVHDLDLKVYNDGTRLYSNFGGGDGDYAGQEDTFNNAEKTTIASSSLTVGSTITVTVETNGLSYADAQKFAVVITGAIKVPQPSASPTMLPTADDTVSISCSFELSATAAATDSDKTILKQTIADALNVSLTGVKNYVVSSVSSRRMRRNLLTYTWTTTFDVTVSLATTTSSTSSAYSTFVATTLTSSSFTGDVASNIAGATVDTSSVITGVVTRAPTSAPTSPKNSSNDDDSSISAGAIAGIVIGVIFIVVGAAIVGVWYVRTYRSSNQALADKGINAMGDPSGTGEVKAPVVPMVAMKRTPPPPPNKPKKVPPPPPPKPKPIVPGSPGFTVTNPLGRDL